MHILFFIITALPHSLLAVDPLMIPPLNLAFDRALVRSEKFELQPKSDSDADILRSFRGDKGEYVRVIERDGIDPKAANGFFKSKMVQIKMLFTPQTVPYSGAITISAQCLSQARLQNKIQDHKGQRSVFFQLNATENFVYGTCAPEQEKFASQYLLLYCKKAKIFYELKFFAPKAKTRYATPVAHCL